jgi:aspartyl-tRNA(Asn)/glutamyl-tRNA(Gln) amidotransferase subunit C
MHPDEFDMKIDAEVVEAVARLANLEFGERERDRFVSQFAEIVDFVEKLSEVDTSGIEADDIHGRTENVIHPDAPVAGLQRPEALANAPRHDREFFLVPKVIADE